MGHGTTFLLIVVFGGGIVMVLELFILLNNKYFGLRRKQRLQQKQPLRGLSKFGFSPTDTVCPEVAGIVNGSGNLGYRGQVNGYAVEIRFDHKVELFAAPV